MAKDKPITIYATRFTEEEQKAENERFINEQSPPVNVYADDTNTQVDNPVRAPEVQVQQINESYWAQPENIVRQYDLDRSNPADTAERIAPARDEISAAYDYLANNKFKGKPQSEWTSLEINDPYYTNILSNWNDPTQPQTPEAKAVLSQVGELSQPKEMQGTYQELNPARKADVLAIPTGTKTEGEPWYANPLRGVIPGLGMASVGKVSGDVAAFALKKIAPKALGGWGWLPTVASLGTAAVGAYTSITGKEAPEWLNKTARVLDIIGTTTEKALIGLPATVKALHPEIDTNSNWTYRNPNLEVKEGHQDLLEGMGDAFDNFFDVAGEFIKYAAGKENVIDDTNLSAAWVTGSMGFEENPQAGVTGIIDNVVNMVMGLPVAKRDEYFRSELGINEPVKADLTGDEAYQLMYNALSEKMKLINPNTGNKYSWNEIEDELVLPFATAQYGISGAKSDIVGQEVFDPTNYASNISNSVVNTYAKATGNKPLQTAVNINTGENIAPFPLNALSSTQKTGGINELQEIYKKVLRGELGNNAPKVDSLSQMDRVTANLTPEGTFAELQPGQATGRFAWIKNIGRLTEESKADLMVNETVNMISEISLLSDSPDTFKSNIMKMADMMDLSPDDSMSPLYGTAVQKTVSNSLRAIVESGTIDQITDKWNATEGLRNNLTVLSSQLGQTPDEIVRLIQDRPDAAKALVRNYAAANNNTIMNQVLTDDGSSITDQFKVFTDKKDPLPYRIEQVTAGYTAEIADKLSDYTVNLYGIKQQSLALRLSELMKKMQSTMLLGFSPSYAANNLINDMATRAADGVFGFPNVNLWVDRMGITPARMYESMAAFRGGVDKTGSPLTTLKEQIKSKQRAGDVVDKMSDLMSEVNSKTPATKLSGNIEGAESARANVVGQMQYMHSMWKLGKGFDEMDAGLSSRIDSQIPNSSRLVYTAIQNGISVKEIESYLYGEYVKPNVQNIMDGIIKDSYPVNPDTVNEVFGKTGMLQELQSLLDNAASPEERARAVEYVRENMSASAKLYMDNQLMSDAENTRNDVISSGDGNQRLSKSMEYMSYMAISRADQWIRTRDSYSGAYAEKLRRAKDPNDYMGPNEWRNYISSVAAQNRAQWSTFNARERQVYAGILRGLGFNSDTSLRYSNYVLDYQANWEDFYAVQKQNIDRYYDSQAAFYTANDQTVQYYTWEDYLADTDKAYEDHFQNEMLIQEKMNDVFLQGYYDSIGLDTAPLKSFMDQIIVIRHDMHDMQVEIRERTKNMKDQLKNEAYLEFEPLYNAKIQQIADLQSQISATLSRDPADLRREQSGNPVRSADPVQPPSDFERAAAILRANEAIKTAGDIRDQAEADLQNAVENSSNRIYFAEFESRLAANTDYFNSLDMQTLDNFIVEHKNDFTDSEWKQIYKHYDESYFDVDNLNIAARIREKIFDGNLESTNVEPVRISVTFDSPEAEALFVASAQEQFDAGFPVSIEQLKRVTSAVEPEIIPVLDFDPRSLELKPGEYFSDPNDIYAKRAEAYYQGDYLISANVYKGEQLIALYTNSLPLKEIPFNGKIYDVLGVDPANNSAYVFFDGEDVITVNPWGSIPADFMTEETPTVPKGGQNQVPLTMPTGEAYAELMDKYVNPILNQFLPRYEEELTRNKAAKSFSTLDTQTKIDLEKYLTSIRERLSATKYNAIKYGEMKRDQALLNYNKRYGFDTFLTVVSPYQFWYTRSMLNWAKRMIDRPIWFTTYARLKEKEELFARDDFPTRLDGRFRINMPYLEDWLGGGYYIDSLSQFFPFAQFLKKAEDYTSDKNILVKKTETMLKNQLDDGIIGSQEYLEALKNRENTAWKAAYAETSDKYGGDPTMGGLFQQYLSLPFLADWYIKKQQGKKDEIYNLPITRTGLTMQTLTKDTPLETVGELAGGALTLPEQGLRKLYDIDYNELGSYGDYAIRKQISQMGNAGEISRQEMLDAQRSMSGEIYDEAYRRQREELMLRTQGAAAIDSMVEFIKGKASFSDVLQALFVAPFGGLVYPKDEVELRKQSEELTAAYDAKADGSNPKAVNEFYDKYPAYIGRLASFKDSGEELNKYIAYQNITNEYYSKSKADKVAILDALGNDFYNAIINPETKNYSAVPYEDLLTWEYALRGDIPNMPASAINKANAPKIRYFTPEVNQSVDAFDQYKKANYPNIDATSDQYYALPRESRKQYLVSHPELTQYWDDKRQYEAQNPEFAAFKDIESAMYKERMAANCFAEMGDSVINDLDYSTITGAGLRSASMVKLEYLYEKYADPNYDTFDEFIEILKRYK